MRIKTHMLPIRIVSDIVVASTVQNGVDGWLEGRVGDDRPAGHGLE